MPVPPRDADASSGGNAASRMDGPASRMGGPGGLGNREPAALASSALSDVSGGAGSVVVVSAPEQQGAFGGSDAVLLTATTQRLSTGQPLPSGGVVDTAHLPAVGTTVREWNARAQAVCSRVAAPPLVEEEPASDTAAQERLTEAALATLGSDHGAWGSTPTASLAPEQVGYFESASNSAAGAASAPEREAAAAGSGTASLTSWVVPPQTATLHSFPASLAATENATGDTFGSLEVRLSIKWRFHGLLASGLAFSG